jgi:hypothetical protein
MVGRKYVIFCWGVWDLVIDLKDRDRDTESHREHG